MAEHFKDIVHLIVDYSERKLRAIKTLRGVSRSWAAVLQLPGFYLNGVKSSPSAALAAFGGSHGIWAEDMVYTVTCCNITVEITYSTDNMFSPRLIPSRGCHSSMMLTDAKTTLITYDVADHCVEDIKDLFPRTAPFYKKIREQVADHTIESLMTGAVVATLVINGTIVKFNYEDIEVTIDGITHLVHGIVAIVREIPQLETLYVVRSAHHYWHTTSRAAAMWFSDHMVSQVFAHVWA
jgi:hypothetical protein